MYFFFVFKQKTAYEMRISDWSSDVCSSDLRQADDDAVAGELVRSHALELAQVSHALGHRRPRKGGGECGAEGGEGKEDAADHCGHHQKGEIMLKNRPSQPCLLDCWSAPLPLYSIRASATRVEGKIGRASGRERGCQDV